MIAGGVHQFGDFSFNLATRTLTRAGKPVPLTTGEFSVLKVLVQHPRQPLSRDKLMELARARLELVDAVDLEGREHRRHDQPRDQQERPREQSHLEASASGTNT